MGNLPFCFVEPFSLYELCDKVILPIGSQTSCSQVTFNEARFSHNKAKVKNLNCWFFGCPKLFKKYIIKKKDFMNFFVDIVVKKAFFVWNFLFGKSCHPKKITFSASGWRKGWEWCGVAQKLRKMFKVYQCHPLPFILWWRDNLEKLLALH